MSDGIERIHRTAEEDPDYEFDAYTMFGAQLSPRQFPDWVHEPRTWGARKPQELDLSGPTHPTQPMVTAGGLAHYLDSGDVENTYGQAFQDDDHPEYAVMGRYPNVVRQGGVNHVLEGHHRIGAAFVRGESSVLGRMVDLDAYSEDSRAARGRRR